MARPSKLNDIVTVQLPNGSTRQLARSEAVLELVRQGAPHLVAAIRAGIVERTFYNWVEKGKAAKSGQYRDFYDALQLAEATAEGTLVLQMRKHAAKEWRATAWMLERRFPDRWRERKQVDTTLSAPGGGPVGTVVVATADMDAAQLAALSGVNLDDMDALALPTDPLPEADPGPGCAECGAGLGKAHRGDCATLTPQD